MAHTRGLNRIITYHLIIQLYCNLKNLRTLPRPDVRLLPIVLVLMFSLLLKRKLLKTKYLLGQNSSLGCLPQLLENQLPSCPGIEGCH